MKDSPVERVTFDQLKKDEAEALLEGARRRRLSAYETWKAATRAAMEKKNTKLGEQLQKQCNMLEKELVRLDNNIAKVENRLIKVQSLKLEVEQLEEALYQ